jgi:hypothetical protein
LAFEKHGSQIWSDNPAHQQRDWKEQGLALGVTAGLGVGAFAAGVAVRPDGTRLIDDVATYARTAGNLSPFQLGNTYRIGELLSPYTSPIHQGMSDIGEGKYSFSIGKEHLKTNDTYQYIRRLTGFDDSQMADFGFGKTATTQASELVFERTATNATGRLYSKIGDEKILLQNKGKPIEAMLQQFTTEGGGLLESLDKDKSVNRIAHSIMQAMDMWSSKTKFNPSNVFRKTGENIEDLHARPKFFPVPAISAKINSVDDLWRNSTLLRGMPAASMERFNRLVGGVTEEVFGKGSTTFLKGVTGAGAGITPGPAGGMYLRLGTKAAAVLGVGVAVQQADWFRRQAGAPGDVLASAGVSAGLAYLGKKGGLKGRTSMMVGLASFAGQMILPGFDQGIMPGIASTVTGADVLRGSAINPFNYYRRTIEGFVPGASDWKTGAGIGIAASMVSYATPADIMDPIGLMADTAFRGKQPKGFGLISGRSLTQWAIDTVGHDRLGLKQGAGPTKTVRQNFWEEMYQDQGFRGKASAATLDRLEKSYDAGGKYLSSSMRTDLMSAYRESGYSGVKLRSHMNRLWSVAEDMHKTQAPKNTMSAALVESLEDISQRYSGKNASFMMHVEGIASQWKHAFFGADLSSKEVVSAIQSTGVKAPLGRLGLIFGGTALAHQVLTGGLLGSMETSQELKDIYSGRQLIEVGKSRWWEGGGTPFEGSKTSYYRPRAYALMMNRVREKGIWGEDEDEISPIGKILRRNLTYELERRQYHDRPYPISSAAFSDIPLIGGALAATVGRVIKPAKLMHVAEWTRQGEDGDFEYASRYEGWRNEPAYSLGATKPGVPSSPHSVTNVMSFMNYQFRELEGMTGWTKNVLSDLITGTDTYFTDRPQLAESGMMTSHRLRFWESATGGGFFMNEAIRRVFPNYRKEIERQNPIMNSMPEWIPEKYHTGDPYRAVEWGEARMPGPGYAALHKELQGVDPEDYPLIYQYDILANIAPFSKEFRMTRERLYKSRETGHTSERMNEFMDRIDEQARERYNIYDFDRVHDNAIQLPGSGLTQAISEYSQKTLRKAVAPAEYMVPMGFRPVQKLLGERNPIERYEYERLYGTPMAFWDKPWRDWFRPAMYSSMNLFGFEGKPMWRRDADENGEYFDRLEFEKWMRLADQAKQQGDGRLATRYQYLAGSTRMGVNPQGNPLSIYWTLPDADRAFFNAFAYAQGSDRERIKEMVPGDQTQLYDAIWKRMDDGDPSLFPGGYNGPDKQHLNNQFYGMGDNQPSPPEDWIGWHSDVDIRDIRVRYINELGKDLHDYGLWENQLKESMSQPYLEGSTEYLHESGGIGRGVASRALYRAGHAAGQGPDLFITSSWGANKVDVQYNDTRDNDMRRALMEQIDGY